MSSPPANTNPPSAITTPTNTVSTTPPAAVSPPSTPSVTNSTSSYPHSATSTGLSSLPVSEPATSASSSQSSREGQHTKSTTGSQSSASSSSITPPQPSLSASSDHRLPNGTVAGIVVGVAIGLALITFLATFLIKRRQSQSKSAKRPRSSQGGREIPLGQPRHPGSTGVPRTRDSYLPQSADDRTIQQKVRSNLDQIELHVENFYRNSSSSALRPDNRELAVFDSPYLSAPLASLLPHSRNKLRIIKHALLQAVTSSLSPTADSTRSLIPTEYTLLPSAITSAKSSVTLKPSKYHLPHIRRPYNVANATKTSPR